MDMSERMGTPKIALGVWPWGSNGIFGGNPTQEQLHLVFDAAMRMV